MSTPLTSSSLSAMGVRLLAAAPHRLLFFVGASNVLLAMMWWALWLIDARWHVIGMPQPAVPAGWLHAIIMQYQVLPAFMFGFLLTVFPRWMSLPALTRAHYVPVGVGLLAGQLCSLAGLFGGLPLLELGALLTATSWAVGTTFLVRLVHLDKGRTWHAVSCAFALGFGVLGLLLYILFLHSADPRLLFASIKVGSIAVLLPIYFTVCHRMIPFFAAAALNGYHARRPLWTLGVLWPLWLLHAWLELRHGYAWLWLPDLAITLLTAWLLYLWWPRASRMPALLRVLFIGFAWLPLAFALFSLQSAWYLATGDFILGRAPAHALFIGFFGSLLVAMVTRVTQGHSGRPLVLGATAGFAFVIVQVVAMTRVLAELLPDSLAWQAIAGLGWILAFVPWVLRSGKIYLSARADGRPG
ncbi:MAG TPA: NnrS family protein [Steroidobacteraceae bacterium]|nr:NnrS family protein [Steroidobacteraceae bacterium]